MNPYNQNMNLRYYLLLLLAVASTSCALRYPERPALSARALSDPRAHIALQRAGRIDSVHAELVTIGNGTLSYYWSAPQPKAIVLIQHGILGYAMRYVNEYNQMIPRLLERGYSVCAIDARSHGYSWGRRATLRVADAVADHRAVRRALASKGLPIYLYGHSMGGIITAASLVEDGADLAGVILMAPALYTPKFAPWAVRVAGTALAAVAPRMPVVKLGEMPRDSTQRDPLVSTRTVPVVSGVTIYTEAKRVSKRYAEVQVPMLFIHSDADRTTDPEGSKRMYRQISSRDKRLLILRGAGHSPLNEKDYRESTLLEIINWLEQRN